MLFQRKAFLLHTNAPSLANYSPMNEWAVWLICLMSDTLGRPMCVLLNSPMVCKVIANFACSSYRCGTVIGNVNTVILPLCLRWRELWTGGSLTSDTELWDLCRNVEEVIGNICSPHYNSMSDDYYSKVRTYWGNNFSLTLDSPGDYSHRPLLSAILLSVLSTSPKSISISNSPTVPPQETVLNWLNQPLNSNNVIHT